MSDQKPESNEHSMERLVKTIKAVTTALAPLSSAVWSYDATAETVIPRVSAKLNVTPLRDIQTPLPHVAVPVLEVLRYKADAASRELLLTLLAACLDVRTTPFAHPAYAEVIKQLTPDEAKIVTYFYHSSHKTLLSVRTVRVPPNGSYTNLEYFSLIEEEVECQYPRAMRLYLDNLCRLGLIEIRLCNPSFLTNGFRRLINHPEIQKLVAFIEEDSRHKAVLDQYDLSPTIFGREFKEVCVAEHDVLRRRDAHLRRS